MAKYGNILTVFTPLPNQLTAISAILTTQKARFELVDSTFFVETNSLTHTRTVETAIAGTNATYTFFHNRISDGSFLKSSIVNQTVVDRIRSIMLE